MGRDTEFSVKVNSGREEFTSIREGFSQWLHYPNVLVSAGRLYIITVSCLYSTKSKNQPDPPTPK